jgi:hypothetical protein
LVALVLAGVVSYYASASPDGLNKVAEDKGFSAQEEESATADSPLAGYETAVDNDRLSGGLAGVAGVVVVLALAGGLAFVVRRRTDDSGEPSAGKPNESADSPALRTD